MPHDHHTRLSTDLVQRPAGSSHRVRAAGLCTLFILMLGAVGCADEPRPSAAPTPTSVPTTEVAAPPSIEEYAAELVANASIRERVASITMGTQPGTSAEELGAFVSRTDIGGFILMGDNIPNDPAQLADLTTSLSGTNTDLPLLIAVDQEGGEVTRIPWDDHASAITLKTLEPDAAGEAFADRAKLLSDGGVNINFGIVADYSPDPSHFIYGRSLGTSPETASSRVTAAVTAESGSVLSTLKHFPGHGATSGDSHLSLPSTPMSYDEWSGSVAQPFISGIAAGAELLMYGHLTYTAVDAKPASLSAEWHRIAREDLGFDGVAVTDDLGMLLNSGEDARTDPVQNAIEALDAGNDLLLWIAGADEAGLTAMIDGVTNAVDTGRIADDRLTEAATRVTELRLSIGGYGESP